MRLGVWQRLEQDALHEAEHRRRRTDAEREHHDDGRREGRRAPQAAGGEPQVRAAEEMGYGSHCEGSFQVYAERLAARAPARSGPDWLVSVRR